MKKLFLFLLAGIFFGASPYFTGQAIAASSIVVAVDSPPKTMSPHGSNENSNLSVMANFFDELVQRKAAKGTLAPALAVRYEHPDLVNWKFYLRKRVTQWQPIYRRGREIQL